MTTRKQCTGILLSGPAHDIFTLDVYYYKRCYTNFVREKEIEGTTSGAEIHLEDVRVSRKIFTV